MLHSIWWDGGVFLKKNTCTKIMSENKNMNRYTAPKKYFQGNEVNLHNICNIGKTGFVERTRKF